MVLFGPGSGRAIRSTVHGDAAPAGRYRHIGSLVVRRAHLAVAMHTELDRGVGPTTLPVTGIARASIRSTLRLVLRAVGRRLAGLILPREVVA